MAMTKREYYDLLVRSARDGTFPSVDDHGNCRYRGPAGQRCAVGLLIPDDRYTPDLEGISAFSQLLAGALAGLVPEGLTRKDLSRIQQLHDHHALDEDEQVTVWDAGAFVADLNRLPFFADCAPAQEPAPAAPPA